MLNEEIFIKGFAIAEIANFSRAEPEAYENSLKVYRDLKGAMDTSHEEGKEEGIAIGIEIGKERGIAIGTEQGEKKKALDMALLMKAKQYPVKEIAEITGLAATEIEKI